MLTFITKTTLIYSDIRLYNYIGGISLDFVGEIINHKVFGTGKIIEVNNDCIKIKFDDIEEEKDFIYPDALDSYLELENEALSKEVEAELAVLREKRAKKLQKEQELKREALRMEIMRNEKNNVKKSAIKKVDSNIAFKCSYCDGGSSADSIGYKSICSDETIDYNINISKNKSCCAPESGCYQYVEGNISREELDAMHSNDNSFCYESQMLNQWRVFAGTKQKDTNKIKTKKLRNVNRDSLALLTTMLPKEKENNRLIFAVFLLKENYELDYEKDGYLGAHDKYRIELSIEESKKLKFWDFYINQKNPEKIANSSALYRYLTDVQAAQVLKKICEIKKDTPSEELSKEFLEYYCKIKNIDVNEIPEPSGALQQSTVN